MSTQSWSTAQVARMSKVTSRTLRHYDQIGLLRPAAVSGNGLRYYDRDQLLRLQQILVLRDLGLSLEAIATVVNEGADQLEQLRRHHRWLTEERERYDRLARSVAATIRELEGGEKVKPEELFENFDAEKQARYEGELVERYGEKITPHFEESKRRMSTWARADADKVKQTWRALLVRLVELIEAGQPADSAEAQEAVHVHYGWVCQFWTPDRESYPGLGQLYVDSADFRVQFDAEHPRLAEYLRDAIKVYSAARL